MQIECWSDVVPHCKFNDHQEKKKKTHPFHISLYTKHFISPSSAFLSIRINLPCTSQSLTCRISPLWLHTCIVTSTFLSEVFVYLLNSPPSKVTYMSFRTSPKRQGNHNGRRVNFGIIKENLKPSINSLYPKCYRAHEVLVQTLEIKLTILDIQK